MEAQPDLGVDDLFHSSVLDTGQLLLLSLAIVQVGTCLKKNFRAEKRAKMLRSKGRVSVQFGSHVSVQGGSYRTGFGKASVLRRILWARATYVGPGTWANGMRGGACSASWRLTSWAVSGECEMSAMAE